MIVEDASALIDVLLRTHAALAVEDGLFAPGLTLHAPHLIDIESAQVLRRYAAGGEIDDARGHAALDDLADFPIRRYPHDFLLPRVWALRHNLTAYDAVYVALAEAPEAALLTRDRRLAAASGHRARIELVCAFKESKFFLIINRTPRLAGLGELARGPAGRPPDSGFRRSHTKIHAVDTEHGRASRPPPDA